MLSRISLLGGLLAICSAAFAAKSDGEEYLADLQHRFFHAQQTWGNLGINQSAHAPDVPGKPLSIAGVEYAKGLGHHAAGEIVVDLAGEYSRFETLVGLQTLPVGAGSVVFKVFVDDDLRFESGLMKPDSPAREVSVNVSGGEELRLVVTDGGDGVSCDCANWVNARLVRAAKGSVKPRPMLDIAQFAEVVTSDPKRTSGSRADRIQEYHADDVYMETPAQPSADGFYIVTASKEAPAALGLKWLERRRLRSVGFAPAEGSPAFDAKNAQVQCWVGESAWQGGWKALDGSWSQAGLRWTFQPDWAGLPEARGGTRKIRFIFAQPVSIQQLVAMAPTVLGEAKLRVQLEKPLGNDAGRLEVYNGELMGTANPVRTDWQQDRPLSLKVRYGRSRPWMADKTILRFRLPGTAFGVSVEDVLKNGCVYVREAGLYVTQDPPAKSLDEYKREVASKQTVLEEVRTRPDQTFAKATEVIHNGAQDQLPTLLSLACDNHKITVHRNGTVQFSAAPETDDNFVSKLLNQAGHIIPTFGSGKSNKISRKLDGEWMPILVNSVEENGIVYRQRTFVAPLAKGQGKSVVPVGVIEFTAENRGAAAADAALELVIMADGPKNDVAEMTAVPSGALAFRRGRLVSFVQTAEAKPLKMELKETGVRLAGSLPPRATSRFVAFVPMTVTKPDQHAELGNADDLLRATREHWKQQLASAMQVDVPDSLIANVIKASQVHCLIAARNEAQGQRVAAWIASWAYGPLESEAHSIIRGMDYFGHHEFARKSLDYFIHRYSPEGFLTTGYTVMGTGWHLWSLGEHYRLGQDKQWLGKVAPEVSRVCDWIVKQRAKTMNARSDGSKPPEYGLMPPGIMADWNAFAYYFCLNGYYSAGLAAAADALAEVGVERAAGWRATAEEFRQDILRGFAWTQAMMPVYRLRNGTSVPGYPSQLHGPGPTADFFPGEDANRSWCYDVELGSHHLIPFGIIDANSATADNMMNHMEDVQFLADGWFDFPAERSAKDPFNYGGFAKVQPYYCRNGEINALRDDVKPFVRTYFNSLASLLNYENLSLQEHFGGVAAWNKTHETGYFLHQSRLMMVMERGEELWLAPFVTNAWLKDGLSIAATNAPTRFGPVSYRVTSTASQGHIDAVINPPTRNAPRQIVLRLRHPEGKSIQKVTVNGNAHDDFDPAKEIIRIAPTAEKITVRASY